MCGRTRMEVALPRGWEREEYGLILCPVCAGQLHHGLVVRNPARVRAVSTDVPAPSRPASAADRAERRERVRAALRVAFARPNTALAVELGVDAGTVARHRAKLEADGSIPVIRRRGRRASESVRPGASGSDAGRAGR